MMKLFPIRKEILPNVLESVYPKIEAATAYSGGKYKGKDILDSIISGDMQLWGAVDEETQKINGIAITEVVIYPHRKVCRFLCATGDDAGEWIHLITEIEDWAKQVGCSAFEPECRPGWERILKEYGYRKTHVLLSKELGTCH